MEREPKIKEVWCIKAFGNNLFVIRGDLQWKEGFVWYVDELYEKEPNFVPYHETWCSETELGAYKLLHDYLTGRDAEVVRKIKQLEEKT